MSTRSKKILALALGDPSKQHATLEDPGPSSSSAIQESTLDQESSLPYQSTSPKLCNPSQHSPPPHQTKNPYISSSESEPCEDSEESYRPSDNEDSDSVSSLQTSDEDEENGNEIPSVDTNSARTVTSDTWGPCTDLPDKHQFSGQSGLNINSLDLSRPFDIYKHFITDEILDVIVLETNRFAAQLIQAKQLPRRSLLNKWTDTNRVEIEKFLGVLIIMGINKLPKMRLYWSNNEMYSNDLIKKTMTRNRFELLLRCLHFSDNTAPTTNNDRLSKIRTVVEQICLQFQKTLSPAEEVVIDESMVPWRGRLVFRQYLPAKSHKYGIKLYKICTPEAYTYDLRIYAGKNERTDAAETNSDGHTYNICMELLKDLKNEGRIVYIDNYYTSVKLCEDLLKHRTYVCGTLRGNRKGNPKAVCSKKLKKGEVFGEQNQAGVRVLKWQDKRPVLMISSVPSHTPQLTPAGKKNRRGEDVVKPVAVIAYNKAKKGVDLSDQLSSYYTSLRKSIKWYKKVMFEIMLGTCVVNAWVVHNSFNTTAKNMDMLTFREHIVKELLHTEQEQVEMDVEAGGLRDVNLEMGATKKRKRSKSSHRIGKHDGPARQHRKRCTGCYKTIQQERGSIVARKKASKVLTFCEDCEGQPSLCIPCFKKFHEQ